MENINKTLLSIQEEWIRLIADPLVHNEPNEHFSKPFLFALSDELCLDKKLVMLVGQEARDWGEYEDNKASLTSIQQWAINRYNNQFFRNKNSEEYINSPFWSFFRKLRMHNTNICWNNLDKLHRYTSSASKNKTKPLRIRHELVLSQQYGPDNKSLLQREIDAVNPQAIVFLTGPNYTSSMACVFGVNEQALIPYAPTRKNFVSKIEHITGLDIPVFWTYHPNYLRRNAGFTADVLNSIINGLT